MNSPLNQPSLPSAWIPGPLGNRTPDTWLPGGKETGEGARRLLSVEREMCLVLAIVVLGGGSDLSDMVRASGLTCLGVLRRVNIRTAR